MQELQVNAEEELRRLAQFCQGAIGMAALHLQSGGTLNLNADVLFPMASTVKLPLALTVLDRVARNEVALSAMFDIHPREMNPSGPLGDEFLHEGVSVSVLNLLELMIAKSDNTAADVLFRIAGGPPAVRRYLNSLRITGISSDRFMRGFLQAAYDLPLIEDGVSVAATMRSLSDEEVGRLHAISQTANETFTNDVQDNASPSGMVELLRRLWHADGIARGSRDLLLAMLERSTTGYRRIAGRLPKGVRVAVKTGSGPGSANDVGFVTLPDDGGVVALAVYIKGSGLPPREREDLIADVARFAYDFFVMTKPSNRESMSPQDVARAAEA